MTVEERLRACVEAVCPACGGYPYDCNDGDYIAWQATGDTLTLSAGDNALRIESGYRLVITSRGGYEQLKIRLYGALIAAGFQLVRMGGEAYDDAKGEFKWPIDVSYAYDFLTAYEEAESASESEEKNA